jgi:adenylate kinase
MEVLLQEARDAYDSEIVIELESNTADEMEVNVGRIESWLHQWVKDNSTNE